MEAVAEAVDAPTDPSSMDMTTTDGQAKPPVTNKKRPAEELKQLKSEQEKKRLKHNESSKWSHQKAAANVALMKEENKKLKAKVKELIDEKKKNEKGTKKGHRSLWLYWNFVCLLFKCLHCQQNKELTVKTKN